MKKTIRWFKTLFKIVRMYDDDIQNLVDAFHEAAETASEAERRAILSEKIIRERTDVSVDLHYRSAAPSTVIVAGRYRNRDYVQVYGFDHEDFNYLAQLLHDMERHATIKRIDGPPTIMGWAEHEFPDLRD